MDEGKDKHGKGKSKRGAMTASAARTRTRTRTWTQSNVGTAESAVTARRIVGAARTKPLKVVQRERTRTRAQRMLTISTLQKPANDEPEVEVGGLGMSYFNVDALEVRESEWIKIGADTGAGKTAFTRTSHSGSGCLVM